jgi:hypothetical protein
LEAGVQKIFEDFVPNLVWFSACPYNRDGSRLEEGFEAHLLTRLGLLRLL